jgi:hypothetical protein
MAVLTGQLEALKAAGAETVYREKISGVRADRPQLAKLMTSLKDGDVVLVTKLDRLGRSTRELLDLIERIGKAGATFRSLGDRLWDTSSSQKAPCRRRDAGRDRQELRRRPQYDFAVALTAGNIFARVRLCLPTTAVEGGILRAAGLVGGRCYAPSHLSRQKSRWTHRPCGRRRSPVDHRLGLRGDRGDPCGGPRRRSRRTLGPVGQARWPRQR